MTIRAAVIACVQMGMSWETVALAYKLPRLEVEAMVRDAVRKAKRPRGRGRGR